MIAPYCLCAEKDMGEIVLQEESNKKSSKLKLEERHEKNP